MYSMMRYLQSRMMFISNSFSKLIELATRKESQSPHSISEQLKDQFACINDIG